MTGTTPSPKARSWLFLFPWIAVAFAEEPAPPEPFPTAPGLHEVQSTAQSGLSYFLYVPKSLPAEPVPLVISYGKYYQDARGEAESWMPFADRTHCLAAGLAVGNTDKQFLGNLPVNVEIVDRARRSFRVNPYAVLLTCRGIDQVMPSFSGRPDLFRYGAQRDGWNYSYHKRELSEEEHRLLSGSHAWMHMRWGDRFQPQDAAYDEDTFKKAVECFEGLGLKSLRVDKRLQYVQGNHGEIDVVAKWFQEKLDADKDLIQASLKADAVIEKARQLAAKKKAAEALKLLQGLSNKKDTLLPQAAAKLEGAVASLKEGAE